MVARSGHPLVCSDVLELMLRTVPCHHERVGDERLGA
jgi:hypothetical protein